jgi:hypothetical protein
MIMFCLVEPIESLLGNAQVNQADIRIYLPQIRPWISSEIKKYAKTIAVYVIVDRHCTELTWGTLHGYERESVTTSPRALLCDSTPAEKRQEGRKKKSDLFAYEWLAPNESVRLLPLRLLTGC